MKDLIEAHYKEAKESRDPEIINNFLIELSKNPNKDYLSFLDFFMNDLEKQLYENIKLNLIYVIGEIGNLTPLSNDFLELFYNTYYISDRWVRNEIIQAIDKISKNTELNEKSVELISNALNDEYSVIKISTLKLLSNFKNLPDKILKNLIRLMNSKDSEILEGCRRILKRIPQQPDRIFNLLNRSDNYKILKQRGIRSLLLIQYKSIVNAESFREMILNSNWDKTNKENFIKEIITFERILMKNL